MAKTTAKPFVKWVGGKGQLLSTFDHLLPENLSEIESLTYVEPFIGGGAMLFYMLKKFENIEHAIINDINGHLTTTYNVVKNNPDELIASLSGIHKEYIGISNEEGRKEFYLSMRDAFNKGVSSDTETASIFIFLNKTCFNGLYRVNSKGEFNVPFGRYRNPVICDADTIHADSELLQRVDVLNGDFEDTEPFMTEKTFVYIDPPYRPLSSTSNFNSYTSGSFDDEEQIRLKRYIDRLSARKCLIMASNSDCTRENPKDTFLNELYKDYFINRVHAARSVNSNPTKRGKITELLIRNYSNNF